MLLYRNKNKIALRGRKKGKEKFYSKTDEPIVTQEHLFLLQKYEYCAYRNPPNKNLKQTGKIYIFNQNAMNLEINCKKNSGEENQIVKLTTKIFPKIGGK